MILSYFGELYLCPLTVRVVATNRMGRLVGKKREFPVGAEMHTMVSLLLSARISILR